MKTETSTATETSALKGRRWLKSLVGLSLATALFAYGVGVGYYRWPPFALLQGAKTAITQWQPKPTGEAELLIFAFTDPVKETGLYYPPIADFAEVRKANDRIFMLREGFETAFTDLQVLGADQLNRPEGAVPVVRVRFSYQDRQYEAFAYGRLPAAGDGKNSASLVIPGTGLNQSLGLATGDQANYHHGILDALEGRGGEIYTLIKPNEDFLAWHDGNGKKLNGDFIWNWHLNREGSYTASYLVESLAFTKWMQSCFGKTVVAGLSQGGAAALLNALQSRPNQAIVASGYSVIAEEVEWGAHSTLIGVPGYAELFNGSLLAKKLEESPTSYLFSWGTGEIGTFLIDAKEGRTKNFIGHLPNVTVSIHDGGHVFPVSAIKSFLSDKNGRASLNHP